jgi:4-phytase / acid phosphatase
MKRSGAWGVFATALFWIPSLTMGAQAKKQDSQEHLKFVLVLTRHGVRSPTWTNARLDEYSSQPGPEWPVEPGFLTPHGKQLMTLFGGYYRAEFAERGLLSDTGCADEQNVYIRADTDERTLETARGLADGMLPGCKTEVHSLGVGVHDELFHLLGKSSELDSQTALSALSGRIGDDPAALATAYQMPLEAMQKLLASCAQAPCAAATKTVLGVQASLTPAAGDHLVELKGPLSTAATFAENLQLEYLEGMPDSQVGWGSIDKQSMISLMALHAVSSDLVQRTPTIARAQAENLLSQITHTLDQAEEHKPIPAAIGTPKNKIVILVGHDTNISNVAALLDAHWLVNGYQRDDAAPGGALVFELWQRSGRPDALRVYYTVQTLEQMRNTSPLSLQAPPAKAVIFLPGCSKAEDGDPCEWSDFQKTAGAQVHADNLRR